MALDISYTPPPTGRKFMASDAKMRVLMGPVGCVAGDTLIQTEEGAIPIERIDRPVRVLSWNDKTGRYQLSPSGGAFPKGKDYLYRVTTLRGEFVALGLHRVLCADHSYQPVESLRPGQSLHLCSSSLLETTYEALSQSEPDDPRLTQTAVDYLARYAESARLRGQLLLREADTDPAFAPSPAGVQKSLSSFAQTIAVRMGGLWGRLLGRSHHGQLAVQTQTGGCVIPTEHPLQNAGGRTSSLLSERSEGKARQALRSLRTSVARWKVRLFAACSRSYRNSVSDGTIISVERLPFKQVYWDMQVLDTNNYVTAE